MIISFRGALLVRTEGAGAPSVYLPDSRQHSQHQDKTHAVQHFARLFVRGSWVRSLPGFQPVVAEYPDYVLSLNPGGRPGPLKVTVKNGKDSPSGSLDMGLFTGVPLFGSFAPGLTFKGDTQAAAIVELDGGLALTGELTPAEYNWEIPHLDPKEPPIALGRLAWSIDWHLSSGDEEIQITVTDAAGELVGSMALKGGLDGKEPAVIIGNIDQPDATKWPDLQVDRNRDHCPCHDDPRKNDRACPDLDFKWLYRLFDEVEVEKRLAANSKPHHLPVPRIESVRNLTAGRGGPPGFVNSAPPMGIETPTCFPGGL